AVGGSDQGVFQPSPARTHDQQRLGDVDFSELRPLPGEVELHERRSQADQVSLRTYVDLAQHGLDLRAYSIERAVSRLGDLAKTFPGDETARDVAFGIGKREGLLEKLADPHA